MSSAFPYLMFLLVAACTFTLGTVLQPLADAWNKRDASGGIMKVLMGDGRKLFANHFFVKADVAFHGGYYPSIFDQASKAPKGSDHLKGKENPDEHAVGKEQGTDGVSQTQAHDHSGHKSEAEKQHEAEMSFLKPPKDWIEKFGRNFMITEHEHLEGGKERELLPWLRIAAELDPYRPDTYTVASYWLRDLRKFKEAEAFLREGVRNNPDSYEIYFEFGRLCYDDYHDVQRARNLWELALRKWMDTQSREKEPDLLSLDEIAVHLAHLEETEKHYQRAIDLLRIALRGSPHPEALQKQIAELQQKLSQPKS